MTVDRAAGFGARLRAARLRAGLTQQELARRAGMSLRAVRDIENGRVREPRQESAARLAAAAGITTAGRRDGSLRVDVLGPVRLLVSGEQVDVGPAMQRALFGLIAMQPNQIVTVEEIVDVLWGAEPPRSYQGLVHTYVARLRGLLGPSGALAGARGGYRLTLNGDESDLLRFTGLADRVARSEQATEVHRIAGEALRCWRGELLSNVDSKVRGHPAAVAIRARRVGVALAYADAVLRLGDHESAVETLAEIAHAEPLHESLHGRLMLVLAGAGRRAEAVRLFADVRRELAEQLGIEPGAELQTIHLGLLREQDAPSPATDRPVPAQLPADVTWFTGRDDQLKLLDDLLAAVGEEPKGPMPIAAVTGMPGMGKTALAVHWAHRVRDHFPDGQLFLDLRGYALRPPVTEHEALHHFLRALGVGAEAVPTVLEQAAALYRSLLAGRRVLVMLDNATSAEQVRALLPGGAGCIVLVTSRDRLGGLAAREGALRLPLPELTAEESRMLLGLAVAGDRTVADPSATAALADACAHLPLALRIAAANISDDPATPIARYVDDLRDRDLLTALAADGDDHAAVRAAFELSHRTLDQRARRLFRLLGLVPGTDVSAEAAAALTGLTPAEAAASLRLLASGHLVVQRGSGRYGMHDLLRLYAAELAREDDTAGQALGRLYDWYLGSTHSAAALLHPGMARLPEQVPAVMLTDADHATRRLDEEYDNLVAAIGHAAEHGPPAMAWLITDALRPYLWKRGGPSTWAGIAERSLALARSHGDTLAQAAMHLSLADLTMHVNHYDRVLEHTATLITLSRQADWLEGEATGHTLRTAVLWRLGMLADAAAEGELTLATDRRLGLPNGHAATLTNLALINRDLGMLADAEDFCRRALTAAGTDRLTQAISLSNLGEVRHLLGHLDDARRYFDEALAIRHRITDARTCYHLAALFRDTGDLRTAEDFARRALAVCGEIGDRQSEVNALNTLGTVHRTRGEFGAAAARHEQAIALAEVIGERRARAEGQVGLAHALAGLLDTGEALAHASQALATARESGYRLVEHKALSVLSAVHDILGAVNDAARSAEAARDISRETGYRPSEQP